MSCHNIYMYDIFGYTIHTIYFNAEIQILSLLHIYVVWPVVPVSCQPRGLGQWCHYGGVDCTRFTPVRRVTPEIFFGRWPPPALSPYAPLTAFTSTQKPCLCVYRWQHPPPGGAHSPFFPAVSLWERERAGDEHDSSTIPGSAILSCHSAILAAAYSKVHVCRMHTHCKL